MTPHLSVQMYYVYLLQSSSDGSIYIGYTKDLEKRLREHSAGKTYTVRRHSPMEIIYYEAYRSQEDAENREKGLKHHGKALAQLKRRLERSLT